MSEKFRDFFGFLSRDRWLPRRASPWQSPYVKSLIGSIYREYLDHIVILNKHHLRGFLSRYFQYHHNIKTYLSLNKDCP